MKRERVRRWVDGELDALGETTLLEDAERDPELARLIEDARVVRRALDAAEPPPAPGDLVDRSVLLAVQRRAARDAEPAWRRWLRRPRVVRVRVLTLAATLGLVLFAGWALRGARPPGTVAETPPEASPPRAAVTAVRVVLPAVGAHTVSIAGDFNGWDPAALFLEDPEGDGTFVATLHVEPGSYAYMFVIDGERWVTDPYAVNHRDDGFGHQNAVLRVD